MLRSDWIHPKLSETSKKKTVATYEFENGLKDLSGKLGSLFPLYENSKNSISLWGRKIKSLYIGIIAKFNTTAAVYVWKMITS